MGYGANREGVGAWQAELLKLGAVPLLPEPFDLAVTRTLAPDCTVAFEAQVAAGRRFRPCTPLARPTVMRER
jgi:hypothetical protein